MHRSMLVTALAATAVLATACGSPALHQRDRRTVRAGTFVDASGAGAVPGRTVHLMTPAGRVDLTASTPVSSVGGEAVDGDRPLRAAGGTRIVGLSWVLQRASYPDTANRQLTDPYTLFGPPQPVTLWVVVDGTRRRITGVDDLTTTGDRPSNATWLGVPATTHTIGFALDYDGVTQTVDARTGRVDAGRAAPLYQQLPLDQRAYCTLGADAFGGCSIHYAVGYPYVATGGWAPAGRTWLVAEAVVDSDFDAARGITVAGAKPRPALADAIDRYRPFLVSASATSFAVRGHGVSDTVDRDSVRRPLTATLHRSAS